MQRWDLIRPTNPPIGKISPNCVEPFPNKFAHYSLYHSEQSTRPSVGTSAATDHLFMQTPFRDPADPVTLFSRERRRKRMLQFLEAFERRSWPCAPELPYLLPLSSEDVRAMPPLSSDLRR